MLQENEELRRQVEDLSARFEEAEAARQQETRVGNGAHDESAEDGDSSSDEEARRENDRRLRQAHEKLQVMLGLYTDGRLLC